MQRVGCALFLECLVRWAIVHFHNVTHHPHATRRLPPATGEGVQSRARGNDAKNTNKFLSPSTLEPLVRCSFRPH